MRPERVLIENAVDMIFVNFSELWEPVTGSRRALDHAAVNFGPCAVHPPDRRAAPGPSAACREPFIPRAESALSQACVRAWRHFSFLSN